ncbi:MAG TPA: aldo/keto reductase [Amnibacterium sp.]|nr:aldo/keto reductase [Amnibacterium sp.]
MTEPADEPAPSLHPPRRRRHAADEPVVDAALAIVERAQEAMAAQPTLPLLDEPSAPYRLRAIPGTGLAVHPILVTAARFGTTVPAAEAHRILDAHAEIGGTAVEVPDTRSGRQEETVGAWLATRRRRERTALFARVGVPAEHPGTSAAALAAAVERLRRRLRTERIDVLTLAVHDRATSLEETLVALATLLETGRIGAVVAGAHSAERLIEARVAAGQRGLPRFAAVSPVYSVLERATYETSIAPIVAAQELGCFPRSPLAGGFLTGSSASRTGRKRLKDLDPERADRLAAHASRRGLKVVEAVGGIARERGVPTSAVALAWLLARPYVVAPVVGPSAAGEVPALAAAAALRLTRAETAALDRATAG